MPRPGMKSGNMQAVFFFQAEDGIRDHCVTGVQTCALPIYQAWTDITDAGLGQVCFGWAGPVERGAGHYYALSGPSLLIEYDNTQDGANHIHSVWRDLRRDFAGDLLAQHYAGMRH